MENGANLAAVNNEGEVPLDLADEDEMDEFLSDEIDNQGINFISLIENECTILSFDNIINYAVSTCILLFSNLDLEVEEARNEEERVMIEDATSWLNKKKIDEVLDWQGKHFHRNVKFFCSKIKLLGH